mmetsp:Transcript_9138/g.11270  ORF Transcript_9138/g.11270 Transcript_9138/m.11270 type:complete len:467 (-) Transcript_9138:16-1416(-)
MDFPISDRDVNNAYSLLLEIPLSGTRSYRPPSAASILSSSLLDLRPSNIRMATHDALTLQTHPGNHRTPVEQFLQTAVAEHRSYLASSLATGRVFNRHPLLGAPVATRIPSASSLLSIIPSRHISHMQSSSLNHEMASAIDIFANRDHNEEGKSVTQKSGEISDHYPKQTKSGTRSTNLIFDSLPMQSCIDTLEKEPSYRNFSEVPNDDNIQNSGSNNKTFPFILHRILSRTDIEDTISWCPHGRAWKVHNPKFFEEKIIKLYFSHTKYSSFTRQVNGWGFHRILHGPDRDSYYHELFLRGLPHLCKRMRRLKSGAVRTDMRGLEEPNFYRISEMYPLPECEDDMVGRYNESIPSIAKREGINDHCRENIKTEKKRFESDKTDICNRKELVKQNVDQNNAQQELHVYSDVEHHQLARAAVDRSQFLPFDVCYQDNVLQKHLLVQSILARVKDGCTTKLAVNSLNLK